eukprot:CAMPEP_0196726002 /NCGR_PEP_ID=MMETSP1091-20130531/7401_1 /TAXON_ID=302021 /ORGANISM="Rhodomonas sp., Strain CCMP768" /LENGTH=43 /DNA_ID= /DNA_START= /DNA_END= /DNA_ORIENTATION=
MGAESSSDALGCDLVESATVRRTTDTAAKTAGSLAHDIFLAFR